MEHGEHATGHVGAHDTELGKIAHERRVDRRVRVHDALLTPGGAARVHDEQEVGAINGDFGQRVRHIAQRGIKGDGGQVCGDGTDRSDDDSADASVVDQRTQFGPRVELAIDDQRADLRVVQDVLDGVRRQPCVDRNPDQARLLDAQEGVHHLDRVGAQHSHMSPFAQALANQEVRKAVALRVHLRERDNPLIVEDGWALREAIRRTMDQVSQRNARNALSCRKDFRQDRHGMSRWLLGIAHGRFISQVVGRDATFAGMVASVRKPNPVPSCSYFTALPSTLAQVPMNRGCCN